MPCTLRLPAGQYSLRSKSFDQHITIPDHASAVISLHKACTACFALGGVFVGAGLPLAVGGGVIFGENEDNSSNTAGAAAGLGMLIAGGLAVAGGAIYLVLGATHASSGIEVDGVPVAKTDGVRFAADAKGVGLAF